MNTSKRISSVQNPLIKKILLLQEKSRERKKLELFVLEGVRELQLALKGGYQVECLLFQSEIISEKTVFEMMEQLPETVQTMAIAKEVYQKIAYRATTEGVIAVVRCKSHRLENLQFKQKEPLVLVAEAPEKPGNMGALLRTADAADLDAVIIANPRSDLYNPNSIRSSVGCVFTNNIALGTTSEILEFLAKKGISVYCASPGGAEVYATVDFTGPSAIVVGTESEGLSELWLQKAHKNITIPMQGEIDSMNVSVSAAILIFEAKRQRGWY